jgi:hypothetical protein
MLSTVLKLKPYLVCYSVNIEYAVEKEKAKRVSGARDRR